MIKNKPHNHKITFELPMIILLQGVISIDNKYEKYFFTAER